MILAIFSQSFELPDLLTVGLLVLLEGVLSIDNALVLGLLAKRLPKEQQGRALTYGLIGAFVFRILAIAVASFLLHWRWVKFLGGGYLVYVAINHFISPQGDAPDANPIDPAKRPRALSAFWTTVLVIELTDIAFAVDSILAAIAMVSGGEDTPGIHPKLWVIITGGMLGVILMRFAAVLFIRLLDRFPRFTLAAYLLVLIIGGKLLIDFLFNTPAHPHAVDFHSPGSPAFIVFWSLMILCFGLGFLPARKVADAKNKGH